jgi:hypothetical protein
VIFKRRGNPLGKVEDEQRDRESSKENTRGRRNQGKQKQ